MNTLVFLAESNFGTVAWPLIAAAAGVATVLGLMLVLRCNAFLALIAAALVVALLSGIGGADPMKDVGNALGSTAGSIAILIAMASVVGKCMLDSGSADTIVSTAIKFTGKQRAAWGLMGCGFLLSIPVFFDTVFYLLVPLARSLYSKTRKDYVLYVMAICCGGAITHTLVPPTPGPLLVAATLGADVGAVMLIGILVGGPASILGMFFCRLMNRLLNIPMRPLGGMNVDSPANDAEDAALQGKPIKVVPLWLALAPVLLPVFMITFSTIVTTLADGEDRAKLQPGDVINATELVQTIRAEATSGPDTPGARIIASSKLSATQSQLLRDGTGSGEQYVDALNRVLLDPKLFLPASFTKIPIDEKLRSSLLADQLRTKPVDMRRMNRQLLETTYPQWVAKHQWNSTLRLWSDRLTGLGNASLALSIAALISIATLAWAKNRSLTALAGDVEESLMSGGLIILITAAGGAFGAMLQRANISESIQSMIDLQGGGGLMVMIIGFGIAAMLKVAQGSSTVAMIIGSSMVAAMVNIESLPYHAGYLVTAIGGGSLIGSWMNDSGFWVYAKMGGLTESESLKTWTPLLACLGVLALGFSLLFATVLPMKG